MKRRSAFQTALRASIHAAALLASRPAMGDTGEAASKGEQTSEPALAREPSKGDSARDGGGFPLWPGLAVGGLGLVGVAIGIGFAIEAASAADAARTLRDQLPTRESCLGTAFPVECTVIQRRFETHDLLGNGSIVAFSVGGALLATGAALFAVSISNRQPATAEKVTVTSMAPWFTSGSGGLVVGGRF